MHRASRITAFNQETRAIAHPPPKNFSYAPLITPPTASVGHEQKARRSSCRRVIGHLHRHVQMPGTPAGRDRLNQRSGDIRDFARAQVGWRAPRALIMLVGGDKVVSIPARNAPPPVRSGSDRQLVTSIRRPVASVQGSAGEHQSSARTRKQSFDAWALCLPLR